MQRPLVKSHCIQIWRQRTAVLAPAGSPRLGRLEKHARELREEREGERGVRRLQGERYKAVKNALGFRRHVRTPFRSLIIGGWLTGLEFRRCQRLRSDPNDSEL